MPSLFIASNASQQGFVAGGPTDHTIGKHGRSNHGTCGASSQNLLGGIEYRQYQAYLVAKTVVPAGYRNKAANIGGHRVRRQSKIEG
jgi:hypothetical protein